MRFVLLFLVALFPLAAFAHDGVHVKGAYARETSASATNGAVFLTIISPEATHDDVLIGVSTPVADKAELHSMTMDENGVMQMRPLDKLDIPAKKDVVLSPDGNHIMLMGLKSQLKSGKSFPLTLTFEHEGDVDVTVSVKAMSDDTPAPENETTPGHHSMDMDPMSGH